MSHVIVHLTFCNNGHHADSDDGGIVLSYLNS